MTAFTASDSMKTLRSLMGLGSNVTNFSDFFSHVFMWAKPKPTDGSTYGITAKGFSSLTSLPSCYNNSQNGWTYNAIAVSHKKLSKVIVYDHGVSGPVSGPTVSVDSTDNSSSGTFSYSIQLYAGTSARISLADIIGTSAKLGVYCVGASDGATHSVTATATIGSSGTVSVSVSVSGWTAQTYYIYPYLLVGSTYYTIPTITRSQVSVTQYVAPAPSVDGIVITGYSGAVQVGQSFTLHVYEHMSDGTTRDEVTFANMWSGYTSIATISGTGTFTGTAAGTATLKATYMGYEATLPITIEAIPVTLSSISISGYSAIRVGGSFTLAVTAHYSDGTSATVTGSTSWSGFSTGILSRSGSTFTGVGNGTTTITASYGGKTATQSVAVSKAVSKVELSFTELEMEVGQTKALPVATVTYSDGSTDHDVSWSENSNHLSISNGNVVASSEGYDISVIASANADSSKKAALTVQVAPATPVVTLQSITLNHSTLSLTAGGSTSVLIATAHYSNNTSSQLTSSAVTWQIQSGSSYASVDSSGRVTPIAEGTAIVKATYQGCNARCTVTVAAAPSQDVAVTAAKIYYSNADYSGSNIEITPQQAISLTAVVTPSNATIASYSWASSAPAKARVTGATSATCTVTGRVEGSATITLTVTDTQGNIKTRTVTIKVDEGAM